LETLIQDLRYSIRILLRARVFTASVLAMLTLTIGSTAAVFTLVEVLLLRPLAVTSPEQLFTIAAPARNIDLNPSYYSHGFYDYLRASNPVFRNAIASSTAVSSGVNLTDGGVTERVLGELVSGNYFDVLGVRPAAGRVLAPQDDQTPGAHPVLVLSYAFWQRRFSGSQDVVGRTLSVNGTPFTVVGVARRGFFGTRPGFGPDIWATLMMVQPLTAGAIAPQQRNQNYLELMVRLEPDINVRQAQAAAALVYTNWLDEGTVPKASSDHQPPTLQLTPATTGHSLLRGQYSQPLLLLMAAVILLLLIACANVATLLITRATARAREMALRTAIGANRSRLVRQLMTESLTIGVIGGACGWIMSVYFGRILLSFLPANAEVSQFSPDLRIFALTCLVSFGSGLLFGLAPVLQVGRDNPATALKSGTGPLRTARRMFESRDVLTVVQVALAFVLIMGAGLFARTLQNLEAVDMGFRRDNVLLASVDPAKSGYTRPRTAIFFDQLIQRLRAHKGIDAVGLASHGSLSGVLPAGTRFVSNQMHAAGMTAQAGEDLTVYNNFVSAGYFESVGISLRRGRPFTESDRPENVQVAILNEAAARLLFGTEDPIGKRIGRGRQGSADIEVVGLVENAKYMSVREAPLPTVYLPFRGGSPMTVHVKASGDPASVLRVIEQELRGLDATLPLFQVQTIEARVDDALRQERLLATLSTIMSVVATLIATVGLYGLISFSVVQRTREIGIRIAVGAEPRQILSMILRRAFVLVGIGILIGLALAFSGLRVSATVLYGVSPSDPMTVTGAMILLTVVGASAGLVPALNAARTDPCNALRQE
jgi:putative ABC transport system permease protein